MKKAIKKVFSIMFVAVLIFGAMNVNAVESEDEARIREIFETEAPNGVFEINATVPKNYDEFQYFTSYIYYESISKYGSEDVAYSIYCDEELENCKFNIAMQAEDESLPRAFAEYDVTINWKNSSSSVDAMIDSYINKLAERQGRDEGGYFNTYYFMLTDLNLINYYVTAGTRELDNTSINKIINYTEDVKDFFENANLTYSIDLRAGSSYSPFCTEAFGGLLVYYNGVIYGAQDRVGVKPMEILYVPSSTELTDSSLIAAAEKRLKEYMPDSNITITKGSALNTYEDGFGDPLDFSTLTDLTKTTETTYTFNFGGFTADFLIVADSSKMKTPEFASKDLGSNVFITSKDSSVPLDTSVSANKLSSDSIEYKKIKEVLKSDNLYSVNLTLFSNVKNSNITKLDNGSFEVSIPVPSELNGKTLVAYYITSEGKIEEHEVTIKDGYAKFITNHFSVYTLAEKSTTNNPNTGDAENILLSIILVGVSLFGVAGFELYFKRRKKIMINYTK